MSELVLATVSQQDPLWVYCVILGGVALFALLVWLLNRSEPSRRGFGGSVGNALVRMEASFLPGREHLVEAIERDDADEDDQGDPPETGA